MANRKAMAEIVAELHKEPPMLLKSVGYLMHRTWSNGSDVWWDYIDKPGMTLAQIAPERRWPLFEDDQLCVCTPDYAAVCSPDHGSIARHGVENLAPEGRFMWQLEPYMTAAEYKQARAENLVPSEGHLLTPMRGPCGLRHLKLVVKAAWKGPERMKHDDHTAVASMQLQARAVSHNSAT